LGRRGVVWDREGEEGMRVIQRKGRGKGGRKEEEDDLAPQKNSWIRHCSSDTEQVYCMCEVILIVFMCVTCYI
jgi:hypothetical protein